MPITPEELDNRLRLYAWSIRRSGVYNEGKSEKYGWYDTFLRNHCETYVDIEITWKNFERLLTKWQAIR